MIQNNDTFTITTSSATKHPSDDLVNTKLQLSQADQEKFNELLVRYSQKSVVCNQHTYTFPQYHGTNEKEFNVFRKNGLLKKRLAKNPKYPLEEDNKPRLKAKPKEKLKATTRPTAQNEENGQIESRKMVNGAKLDSPVVAPKPVLDSKQKTLPIPSSTSTSIASPTPTPMPTSTPPPAAAAAAAPAPIPALIPTAAAAIAAISSPQTTPAPTLESSSSENTSKESTPAPATAPTSPPTISMPKAPMKWNQIVQSSIPKPKSNGSAPTQNFTSVAGSPEAYTDFLVSSSSSQIPSDNLPKPLGIVSLRIMYDSQLLRNTITNNKNQLVTPHGLINNGSICYMNAVLQLLFACEPFTQVLNIIRNTSMARVDTRNSRMPIMDAILTLHESFKIKKSSEELNGGGSNKNYDVVNPVSFYNAIAKLPRFSHLKWGRQEDAEEFLGYLLDGLHEEFVTSIEDLSITELTQLTECISDADTLTRINNAIELIKDTKLPTGKDSTSSSAADDQWMEVGSNRKVAAKRTVEVKPSPIVQLFGGQFRSVLGIPNKKSSITLDPFMHVQLDISDPETVDLISAFKKFSEVEDISYGSSSAKKQNFIDKLPSILIIHLKRFSFVTHDENSESGDEYEVVSSKQKKKNNNNNNNNNNNAHNVQPSSPMISKGGNTFENGGVGRIEKLHKIVEYSHQLRLPVSCVSSQVNEEPKYKLIGVVYHHGRTAEGGHYTVDVLDSSDLKAKNDEWIRVDDTQVSVISSDMVIENGIHGGSNLDNSKSAYILMYQRV